MAKQMVNWGVKEVPLECQDCIHRWRNVGAYGIAPPDCYDVFEHTYCKNKTTKEDQKIIEKNW